MIGSGDIVGERYHAGNRVHDEPALAFYEGQDLRTGTGVLVVTFREQADPDPAGVAVLRRAAGALRPGGHPHIAGILAVERSGDSTIVVYERPQGDSLAQLERRGGLSQAAVAALAVHLAEALAHVHSRDLVHGALAPPWVYVTPADSAQSVSLVGAGLALACPQVGTGSREASFLAPERRRGAEPLPQSDVYSFGVLLAQCRGGEPSAPDGAPGHERGPARIIRLCTSPKVEERLPSGEELRASVQRELGAYQSPPAPGPAQQGPVGAARPTSAARNGQSPSTPAVRRIRRNGAQGTPEGAQPQPSGRRRRRARSGHPLAGFAIALVLPLAVGLPLGLMYYRWETSRPDDVTVPRIIDKQVSEARDILAARGLKLAIVDQVYRADVPEGRIVWARPAAGRIVKEGRQVRARVSLGARAVEVPDVARLNAKEAVKRLTEMGLKADQRPTGFSEIVAKNAVISQSPAAGRKLREGESVILLISAGPPSEGESPTQAVDPRSLTKKTAQVSFEVPQGDRGQRVCIRVVDDVGDRLAYDALHEPGDVVDEEVSGRGSVTITVTLDEQVIHEETL